MKGAKRLGVRIGNWLTIDQSKTLLRESPSSNLRGKRDRAILALFIGCGLRRAELVGLRTEDFQVREEHSVIAELVGKGQHIRTVPVPLWAKRVVADVHPAVLSHHSTSWNGCTFPAIVFPASSLAGASILAIFAVKNRSSWV